MPLLWKRTIFRLEVCVERALLLPREHPAAITPVPAHWGLRVGTPQQQLHRVLGALGAPGARGAQSPQLRRFLHWLVTETHPAQPRSRESSQHSHCSAHKVLAACCLLFLCLFY